MELLLRTVHGSHLYGLSHAGSDYDLFEVYGWHKFRGRQTIGAQDYTRQSYDRFMRYCGKGVPQYLEAMWSPVAEVDRMPFNRFFYRPDVASTRETYQRTIKNFWLSGQEDDNFKKRRHAIRLWLNLQEMSGRGLFNPVLTDSQVLFVNKQAENPNFGSRVLGII